MNAFLGVIILALGILIGFSLAVALYAFEYVLDRKRSLKMPRKLLEQKLMELPMAKGAGAVLMPETDQEIAQAEKIRRDQEAGRVTKLADL